MTEIVGTPKQSEIAAARVQVRLDEIDKLETDPEMRFLAETPLEGETYTEKLVRRVQQEIPHLSPEEAAAVVYAITGQTALEWGIVWGDDDTVHTYSREEIARGIFKKYGEPGDTLVQRFTSGWIEKETK